jgi:hypothetical protein
LNRRSRPPIRANDEVHRWVGGIFMRHPFWLCLIVASLTSAAVPAAADDQAECSAGITMIKAEIDKKPPQATLTALQRALRSAERELKEAEFDECVDAVADAKKVLGR